LKQTGSSHLLCHDSAQVNPYFELNFAENLTQVQAGFSYLVQFRTDLALLVRLMSAEQSHLKDLAGLLTSRHYSGCPVTKSQAV
jgi:hypothetical protein